MSSALADRRCKPCEGGVPALGQAEITAGLAELHPEWRLAEDGRAITRRFGFPAYSRTLAFANAVAWIAISEGHHPELIVHYDACEVRWTTHAIDGLSDNDFICAAKTDRLVEALP
jgi:4a-hydroxytetrahydrobiopterin dehydratase